MAVMNPVLIASPARSGTTMIAWLLHLHGFWIGEAKVTKAPQTNPQVGTENVAIKDYLKTVPESVVPPNFRACIEALVPPDQPWLFKSAQNLMKMKAWLEAFPDAKWVLPRRPISDIVDSAMRHPGMKGAGKQRRYEIARYHTKLQLHLTRMTGNFHWVDVDRMAKGHESEGHALIEFVGGTFNPDIFNAWIQPERWHG